MGLMCARENGDRIFIEGIGWDCFYYDYDIRRGDTIHFRYNYKDLLMYMSPIHPNGEPKVIISKYILFYISYLFGNILIINNCLIFKIHKADVFDEEERPVAYDNGFNLIQRQVNNMRTLVQTYEDYPAQVHCFTTANIYGNYLVIHRPIVGSLGLQQYGLLLLEMSRQTHQST
ncbi:hypothetical protein VPH35_050965 [Triticum aestivum]